MRTAVRSPFVISGLIGVFLLVGADVIGDGLSSKSSNQEFFSTMDTNLDGTIEKSEVREIVTGFGGRSLDEPDEIKRSVDNVFAQLDTNQDGTLTVAESHSFWRHLGALLSVNEVAAWVVHGIQMPDSVGEVFRSNAVSGYDFAELIEDNGAALEELGITRSVHKKKLVRSIQMLMSGVGITPTPPQSPLVEGISCHSAKVSWQPSDGGGFPVHKYRVFRHSLGNVGNKLTSATALSNNSKQNMKSPPPAASSSVVDLSQSQHYRGDWILVYEGPTPEFIDTGLMSGFRYEYQCEAWSLFGHSSMTAFSGHSWEIDQPVSKPCMNQYLSHENKEENPTLPMQHSAQSAKAAVTSVPLSVPLPTPSTSSLPASSAWQVMPWSSHVLPISPLHETSNNGLFPPPRLALPPGSGGFGNLSNADPNIKLLSFAGLRHLLVDCIYGLWWLIAVIWSPLALIITSLSPIFGIVTALMRVRRTSMNHKNDAADRVHADMTWRLLAFLAAVIPGASYLIPKSLRSDPALYDVSIKNDGSASPAAVGTSGVRNVRPPEMRPNNSNIRIQANGNEDLSRCCGCNKRFRAVSLASLGGIVSVRPKHTCSSCWAVFCGSCGHTSHSWLMTCPVGGGCLCNSCSSSGAASKVKSSEPCTSSAMKDPMPCTPTKGKEGAGSGPFFPPAPVMKNPPLPSLTRPGSFIRSLSRSASLGNFSDQSDTERQRSSSEVKDSLQSITSHAPAVTLNTSQTSLESNKVDASASVKGIIPRNLSKSLFSKKS